MTRFWGGMSRLEGEKLLVEGKGLHCSSLRLVLGVVAKGESLLRARASMPALKSRPVTDTVLFADQGWERRRAVFRPVPQPRSKTEMLGPHFAATWSRRDGSRPFSSSSSMDCNMFPSES